MRSATAVEVSLVVFASAMLTGCLTRNPSIDVARQSDGTYRIEVLRCAWDDPAVRDEIRKDLDATAKRRCPRGHRWRAEPEYARARLGTAALGECPATKAIAIAMCENNE